MLLPYVDAVYAAMWEQQLNMTDVAVINDALQIANPDTAALIAASQRPEVQQWLLQNTPAAHERSAVGSPIFFVIGESYIGKARLHAAGQ